MISCTRQELESARARAQSEAARSIGFRFRWRVMISGDEIRYIYSDAPIPPVIRTLDFQRVIVPGEGSRCVLTKPVRLILSDAELRMARRRNAESQSNHWRYQSRSPIRPPRFADTSGRGHRVEYCEMPVTETGTPTTTPP